jgi:hypothetical protein
MEISYHKNLGTYSIWSKQYKVFIVRKDRNEAISVALQVVEEILAE